MAEKEAGIALSRNVWDAIFDAWDAPKLRHIYLIVPLKSYHTTLVRRGVAITHPGASIDASNDMDYALSIKRARLDAA